MLYLQLQQSFYAFPPVLGYFGMAALAVTPNTHAPRVAFLPIITLLAWRAAVSVDLTEGKPGYPNAIFTFSMLFIVTRTFDWMLVREPLVRYQPPAKGTRSTMMDALDLASTLRGPQWNWARNVYFPHETRPTDRMGFVLHTVMSAIIHAFFCGVLHIAIFSFSPTGLGTFPEGVFDDKLPFHLQYVHASIISACTGLGIYAYIQSCYDACTIVAVLLLRHDPVQWPPAFDAPWCATSLTNFWGCRWHQFFRRMFLVQGGYPLGFLFGKMGLVFGTFLSSGVLHHIAMTSLNDQLEPWRIIVGFVMMAPGIIVEATFNEWTGREVSGVVGWFWTMTWLCLWGNIMVDGFMRAGVFNGYLKFTEYVVPQASRVCVERLITGFDAWLHGI